MIPVSGPRVLAADATAATPAVNKNSDRSVNCIQCTRLLTDTVSAKRIRTGKLRATEYCRGTARHYTPRTAAYNRSIPGPKSFASVGHQTSNDDYRWGRVRVQANVGIVPCPSNLRATVLCSSITCRESSTRSTGLAVTDGYSKMGPFTGSLTPHEFLRQPLAQRQRLVRNLTVWQCLLEILDALVSHLGVGRPESFETDQPPDPFYVSSSVFAVLKRKSLRDAPQHARWSDQTMSSTDPNATDEFTNQLCCKRMAETTQQLQFE